MDRFVAKARASFSRKSRNRSAPDTQRQSQSDNHKQAVKPPASRTGISHGQTLQSAASESRHAEEAHAKPANNAIFEAVEPSKSEGTDAGLEGVLEQTSPGVVEGNKVEPFIPSPPQRLQKESVATLIIPQEDLTLISRDREDDDEGRSRAAEARVRKTGGQPNVNADKPVSAPMPARSITSLENDNYWGPVESIDHGSLSALANSVVRPKAGEFEPSYHVTGQSSGAFHCGYFLESPYGEKLVVRVPATGHQDRWNEVDARLLRDGALGMHFLRKRTDLPVPHLIHYDTTLNNQISAPYILMSFVKGTSLLKAWHASEGDERFREAKRQTILRSIASIMPRFRSVVFRDFGALCFEGTDGENPAIDDAVRLTVGDIFTIKREFRPIPMSGSLSGFIVNGKEARYQDPEFPRDSSNPEVRGLYVLWEMMLEAFQKVASLEGENTDDFVLMQSDFNPQNIMVDDEGKVVGLIDWDCIETVPRQVGWSVVPHWLAEDWADDYHWPVQTELPEDSQPQAFARYRGLLKLTTPDDYDRYRRDYARYLKEACAGTVGDERFTSKSHIYRALLSSHEAFGKVKSFVCNVLVDIMPRNAETLTIFLGDVGANGFQESQRMWLEGRLARYFRPEG